MFPVIKVTPLPVNTPIYVCACFRLSFAKGSFIIHNMFISLYLSIQTVVLGGVGVLFNCKLGSKICKKIFETWKRCNFSSCIFLAVDCSWQMSTSKTRPRLMGFVNFLIFFVFFAKIVIFYQATAKIAPFNSVHQDLSIGTFGAFGRTNRSNRYRNIEIFGDFPYLRHASSDRHV